VKYRVSFAVPPNVDRAVAQMLVQGQELEADQYRVQDSGWLEFYQKGPLDHPTQHGVQFVADVLIIAYAPGVVRSVANVGAFAEATLSVKGSREAPPRPHEAREA